MGCMILHDNASPHAAPRASRPDRLHLQRTRTETADDRRMFRNLMISILSEICTAMIILDELKWSRITAATRDRTEARNAVTDNKKPFAFRSRTVRGRTTALSRRQTVRTAPGRSTEGGSIAAFMRYVRRSDLAQHVGRQT